MISVWFIFSAYGESVFLLIQTIITAFLVMRYTDRQTFSIFYLGTYGAILAYVMSPIVPRSVLWYLQASVIPNVVIARVSEWYSSYRIHMNIHIPAKCLFNSNAGSWSSQLFKGSPNHWDFKISHKKSSVSEKLSEFSKEASVLQHCQWDISHNLHCSKFCPHLINRTNRIENQINLW